MAEKCTVRPVVSRAGRPVHACLRSHLRLGLGLDLRAVCDGNEGRNEKNKDAQEAHCCLWGMQKSEQASIRKFSIENRASKLHRKAFSMHTMHNHFGKLPSFPFFDRFLPLRA